MVPTSTCEANATADDTVADAMGVALSAASALTGEILWGPVRVHGSDSVASVRRQVAERLQRPCASLLILHDSRELLPSRTIAEEGLADDAVLGITVVRLSDAVRRIPEEDLVKAGLRFERPPKWRDLLNASPQGRRGIVKGVVMGIMRQGDLGPDAVLGSLLSSLGLLPNASKSLPESLRTSPLANSIPLRWMRERAGAIGNLEPPEVEAFLLEICAVAASENVEAPQTLRRITGWPKTTRPQQLAALLVIGKLMEVDHDLQAPLTNELVDSAAAEIFVGNPDFPLVRRAILGMKLLVQKPLASGASPSHMYINESEVWSLLEDTLQCA